MAKDTERQARMNAVYEAKRAEIAEQLKRLSAWVNDENAGAPADVDWGWIGNLEHVTTQLRYLENFAGMREDEDY